jgi:hypothetical protein
VVSPLKGERETTALLEGVPNEKESGDAVRPVGDCNEIENAFGG